MNTLSKVSMAVAGLMLAFLSSAYIAKHSVQSPTKIIVIDPGHGGEDEGAVNGHLKEKELTLKIAKRVRELAGDEDFKVVLSRGWDMKIENKDRVTAAMNHDAHLLISLHVNQAYNEDKSGIEVYYDPDHKLADHSRKFARLFFENYNEYGTGMNVGGIHPAGFLVLKNAPCPSVMIEAGYLSNEGDAELLQNEDFVEILARTTLNAISEYE